MADAVQTSPVKDKLDSNVVMHRNITKLESSDFYKKLTPAKKVAVQTQFYNRFVTPVHKELNYKGSLQEWLKGRAGKLTVSGETSTTEKALGAIGHGTLSLTKPITKLAEKVAGDWDKGKEFEQSGVKQFINKVYQRDEDWMEQHYDNHLKDEAIKEVGTMVGQSPALMLGSGILKATGLTELLGASATSPKIVQVGSRMLHSAMDGYIFGAATGDDPTKSAEGFALGVELFRPVEKFVGKLIGLGGQKLLKEASESVVKAVSEKAPEATGEISAIVTGLAGSTKQKINASTIQALNDLTGGNFVKASKWQQDQAIAKLGKVAPEISGELGFINERIVEAKAASQTLKQRAMIPEFNDILTKLEKVSGTPAPKAIAESVAKKAENRQLVKKASQVSQTVPGAASAKSYEFEDNLSKRIGQGLDTLGLGKDKLVWEDRGHKLLFYLNLLLTDQKSLGPNKERNKQFQFLLQHLNDRFKDATLPDLIKMSDNLWTHIEQLTKAGIMEEGKPTRIFRQTELREGESPFGHQVKLLREAQTKEINDRMDADAFKKLKEGAK